MHGTNIKKNLISC